MPQDSTDLMDSMAVMDAVGQLASMESQAHQDSMASMASTDLMDAMDVTAVLGVLESQDWMDLTGLTDSQEFQEYQDVMHLFSVDGDMAVSTTTKLCMYMFISAVFLYNRLYLYIMHSICVNRKNIKPDFWKSKFAWLPWLHTLQLQVNLQEHTLKHFEHFTTASILYQIHPFLQEIHPTFGAY